MDMQDKEFDDLFRSKLEGFEAEPSRKVWQGIAGGLDAGKRNRAAIIPFLSIAASIIVLIGVDVFFIPQKDRHAKPQPAKTGIAKVNTPPNIKEPVKSVAPQQIAEKVNPQAAPVNQVAKVQLPVVNRGAVTSGKVMAVAKSDDSAKLGSQPVLAAIPQKQNAPVVQKTIDTITLLAAVPVIKQPVKPADLTATLPAATVPIAAAPVKKPHPQTFGDVLNTVIAAVDKRKDKIIEFSNTDDDEASITGINIGFIKIKKHN